MRGEDPAVCVRSRKLKLTGCAIEVHPAVQGNLFPRYEDKRGQRGDSKSGVKHGVVLLLGLDQRLLAVGIPNIGVVPSIGIGVEWNIVGIGGSDIGRAFDSADHATDSGGKIANRVCDAGNCVIRIGPKTCNTSGACIGNLVCSYGVVHFFRFFSKAINSSPAPISKGKGEGL